MCGYCSKNVIELEIISGMQCENRFQFVYDNASVLQNSHYRVNSTAVIVGLLNAR